MANQKPSHGETPLEKFYKIIKREQDQDMVRIPCRPNPFNYKIVIDCQAPPQYAKDSYRNMDKGIGTNDFKKLKVN